MCFKARRKSHLFFVVILWLNQLLLRSIQFAVDPLHSAEPQFPLVCNYIKDRQLSLDQNFAV